MGIEIENRQVIEDNYIFKSIIPIFRQHRCLNLHLSVISSSLKRVAFTDTFFFFSFFLLSVAVAVFHRILVLHNAAMRTRIYVQNIYR